MRQFPDGSGELIAYERVDQTGPKESVYTRVSCREVAGLIEALSKVLPVRGRVLKHREVLMVGRARVHLDEVQNLGSFIELEVVLHEGEPLEIGEREARDLLEALAIPPTALVADAYIDLLEQAAL